MNDNFNIEDDFETPANIDLSEISKIAAEMIKLEAEIEALETELSEKKGQLSGIQTESLPNLMQSFGLKNFTLTNGAQVIVDSIIKANLPTKAAIEKADSDRRAELQGRLAEAFAFLRENKAAELIRNELSLEFSKGQDNIVGEFVGKAEEMGIPHKREENVNHATLSKWVKDRMTAGEFVPLETFGVFVGKKAVIKYPAKRKSTKPKD